MPLHIAAKQGHLPMTKLLLDRGGDPNVKGRNELTPLHVATHYGHPDVAMHLLDKGADPECQAKVRIVLSMSLKCYSNDTQLLLLYKYYCYSYSNVIQVLLKCY